MTARRRVVGAAGRLQPDRLTVSREWTETILWKAGFRDFTLVPQKLVRDPDNEEKKKVAASPKYKMWRTNPPPKQWAGANAFLLLTEEPWIVADADSPETKEFEDYLVAVGCLPRPRLVVASSPGRQHLYWPKAGDWNFNRRLDDLDFIDLSTSGIYAPGSYHPVSQTKYLVLEINPESPSLDEDTFMEALFGEGLREFNGIRELAGLKTVRLRRARFASKVGNDPSAHNKSLEEPVCTSGRLGAGDRNATLFHLAHHLWYEKGIRDRNVIAAKLLARNSEPYPDANHDEPLPEDRVRAIAENIAYGSGANANVGFRLRQRQKGVVSGSSRRRKGNTDAVRRWARMYRSDGLTQKEIGENLGRSQQYVSSLLEGMPRGVNTGSYTHNTSSSSSVVSAEEAFTDSTLPDGPNDDLSDTEKRRKRVKMQFARGLKKTRMAELCGVTRQTIYDDIKWLEEHPDAFRKPKSTKPKKRRRTVRERPVEELMPDWGENHAEFVYSIEAQLRKQEAARRKKQRKKDAWIAELPDKLRSYFDNVMLLHSEPTGSQVDTMEKTLAETENAMLRAEIQEGLDDGWNIQWKWGWTEEESGRIKAAIKEGLASA